jgi:glycosyltransferase involved in cell wall biosynthesis
MRILFISAFYPPHVAGGWEQLIEDMNGRLRARGHATYVLTSRHGLDGPAADGDVARVLHLESDLQHYRPRSALSQGARLRENLAATEEAIASFRPDVVFVQVLWNLSRGVPWTAEQRLPGRVVYYMASPRAYLPDTRAVYWESPAAGPLRSVAKHAVAPFALRTIRREHDRFRLRFDHVLCVSDASRQAVAVELGRDPATIRVVPNGIEPERFFPRLGWEAGFDGRGLSVLFAGTLARHKGVHTAVEAMGLLPPEANGGPLTLTIVGSGQESYETQLRERVAALGLGERVTFYGRVPRQAMPDLMRR